MKSTLYNNEPERFSRPWWWMAVRSSIWVIVITVLIWVYADLEYTETMEFRATLRFTTGDNGKLLLLSERDRQIDSLKIQGTRTALERFRRDLADRGGVITHDVSGLGSGRKLVQTAEIITEAASLTQHGLSIVSISPLQVALQLDERVFVPKVPVKFEYAGAELDRPATIEPPEVGVYIAQSVLSKLDKDAMFVRTGTVNLQGVDRQKPVTLPARLTSEVYVEGRGAFPVELDRQTVDVTVQVRQTTGTQRFTVPVQVTAPPTWGEDGVWVEYSLVRQDPLQWLQEITVTGPVEDLAKLRQVDIQAFIVLTDAHRRPLMSWDTLPVTVVLPEGLNLKVMPPRPTVSFKLERRSDTGT